MPVDADGNRADVIMDPNSVINRANPGQFFEQYFNASARDTHKRLCAQLGVAPFMREMDAYNHIAKLPKEQVMQSFLYLKRFYQITTPVMASWFDEGKIEATNEEYLAEIVNKGISLYIPTDNQIVTQEAVLELEREYKPTYGPVTYVGENGNVVTTKKPVRIGSVYLILLEKIGDDWSAVSSGKLQHFGVLSPLTRGDKYAKPSRNQAVRGAGEAEVRIFVSYIGPTFVAELMDRNNNPRTHKSMVEKILKAEKPGHIENLVDRNAIPFGGSKPLNVLKHLVSVSGMRFQYKPYKSPTTDVVEKT